MRTQINALVAFLFILALAACAAEIETSEFDREFFRMSTSEQIEKFSKFDLQVQYRLVVVGNQVVHPPALYLTQEFAKRGVVAIPLLSAELTNAQSELTVRDIVAILAEMRRLHVYDVKENVQLMALVRDRVASMKGQWRLLTDGMEQEIEAK